MNGAKKSYDDIVQTKWTGSTKRAHMPLSLRAKIFMPFAALKGFDELIKQTEADAAASERVADGTSASRAPLSSLLALVLVLFCLPLFFSCSAGASPRYAFALGTVCTVNAFEDGSERLYDAVFARISELEHIFSVTDSQSELSAVNATAAHAPVAISAELFTVLSAALRIAEQTDGALNPALGPLVSLWGIQTEHARVPSADEIAACRRRCNWRDVVLTVLPAATDSNAAGGSSAGSSDAGSTQAYVFFKQQGMALDLGAVAKGYVADELVRLLHEQGVRRAVVNLGGNVYTVGIKADGSPWRVGIKNPRAPERESMLSVEVAEEAVVTSGNYERYFEQDGVRYHHILDTATGRPAERGVLSVTVIAKNALQADALSTALFVLGVEQGLALTESLPGVEAVFIDSDCAVHATSGARVQ